jgi:hypothetical protein
MMPARRALEREYTVARRDDVNLDALGCRRPDFEAALPPGEIRRTQRNLKVFTSIGHNS